MSRMIRVANAIARQWPSALVESLGLKKSTAEVQPAHAPLPAAEQWERNDFAALWLGQATVLLRMSGKTILTDPHFQERSGFRVGTRRVGRPRSTALPGEIDQLPPVDIIALSHAHLDHWDKASLRRLARPETTVIIPRRTRRLLPRGFGAVVELDWGCEASVGDVVFRSIRPKHWGARYLWDIHRGYNAYLMQTGAASALFTGDTAYTDAFDDLEGVDLAIIGIGNYYEPWDDVHATPEQAAEMARRMGARRLMPIHHSTFRDEVEPIDEPVRRLLEVWDEDRTVCSRVGELAVME